MRGDGTFGTLGSRHRGEIELEAHPVETTNPEGEVVTFSPSATDACDPSPSIWSEPASGSTFAFGTTTVTVTATDVRGNFSTCTFEVLVREPDTTPPVVTCPGDQVAECTSPEGAFVSFAATATDDRDPTPTVECVPPSGSTFPIGTTTLSCTATDYAGNFDTCSFEVTIVDTTPPALSCPAVIVALEAKGSPAGEQAFFSVTASDAGDPAPWLVCVPLSGSFFPRGTTIVTCMATDASGNQTTRMFPVVVRLPVLPRRQ